MTKKKESKFNQKYEVVDAFRFFFFLVILIFGVSFVFDLILNIVSSSRGIKYDDLCNLEIVQIISQALTPITLIIYFIIYNSIRKIKFSEAFGEEERISLLPISVAIVLAIIAIFLFTPLMNLIDYWFQSGGYNPDNTIPLEQKMKDGGAYLGIGIIIYALLPAIAEEIVFRGVIQKSLLSKFSGFVAVFFSSVLFVLMHGALQQTVYQLVMAIMLGYLACVGGSIVYSIILHFLNNALVVLFSCFDIVSYLSAENTIYYNVFSMIFPFCLFLLGVILVGILFWVLKYLRNKNFFRYESKTARKLRKQKELELSNQKKLGLKDFWGNITQVEKLFMLISVALIGFLWLVNTINGFIV